MQSSITPWPTMPHPISPSFAHKPTVWALAEAAVKSIDGSLPLSDLQKEALEQWTDFKTSAVTHTPCSSTRTTALALLELNTASKIFSNLFFLGKLSSLSKLKVQWSASLERDVRGQHTQASPDSPSILCLNCTHSDLYFSPEETLRVLLHEMIHAYLQDCRAARERFRFYGMWFIERVEDGAVPLPPPPAGDWTTTTTGCTTILKACIDDPDLGVSGHGRAFLHIAHAIEKRTGEVLGLGGSLGRGEAMLSELEAIANVIEECSIVPERDPREVGEMLLRPIMEDCVKVKGMHAQPPFLMIYIRIMQTIRGSESVVRMGEVLRVPGRFGEVERMIRETLGIMWCEIVRLDGEGRCTRKFRNFERWIGQELRMILEERRMIIADAESPGVGEHLKHEHGR